MKKILALFIALICLTGLAETPASELRHIVALKFKSEATPEQIKKIESAFRELKSKIPQVVSLEWGTNVSVDQRNKGFTHCFVLSFKSDNDLKTYADSSEHKSFVAILRPVMEDVFVFDFWSQH